MRRIAATKERKQRVSQVATLLSEVVLVSTGMKRGSISALTAAMKDLKVDPRGIQKFIEDKNTYMMLQVTDSPDQCIRQIFNPIPRDLFLACRNLDRTGDAGYCLKSPFIPAQDPIRSLDEFVSTLSNLLHEKASVSKLTKEERDDVFNLLVALTWACVDDVNLSAFQPLVSAYVFEASENWVRWVSQESKAAWVIAVRLLAELYNSKVRRNDLAKVGVKIFNNYLRGHLFVNHGEIVPRRETPLDVRILLCLAGFGANAFGAREFEESITRIPLTHGAQCAKKSNRTARQNSFSWKNFKAFMSQNSSRRKPSTVNTPTQGKYYVSYNQINDSFDSARQETPNIHWFPVYLSDELSWSDVADKEANFSNTPWSLIRKRVYTELTSKLTPTERLNFDLARLEDFCFWKQSMLGTTRQSKCNRNCFYLDSTSTAYEATLLRDYLKKIYCEGGKMTFEQFHLLWFVYSRFPGDTVKDVIHERLVSEITSYDSQKQFNHLEEFEPWRAAAKQFSEVDMNDLPKLFESRRSDVIEAEILAMREILRSFGNLESLTPPLREELQSFLTRDLTMIQDHVVPSGAIRMDVGFVRWLQRDIGYLKFLRDKGPNLTSKLLEPENNDFRETRSQKNYEIETFGIGSIIRSS